MQTEMIVKATEYYHGPALKALGDGRVGGYLVVFGGPKDAQGEYFRADCDFHLGWFNGAKRPILYHHGLKEQDIIEEIGFITDIRPDGHGVWGEGQLDMSNPRAQQVYQDVLKNRIGWSSGSSPHLSKVEEDGGISEWAIIEASLTPTPAAGKRTTVQALKFDKSTFELDSIPTLRIEPVSAKDVVATKGKKGSKGKSNSRRVTMFTKADTNLIEALQKAGCTSDQVVEVLKELAAGATEEPEAEMMADTSTGETPPPADMATMAAPEDEAAEKANFATIGDQVSISDSGSTPAMNPPKQPEPGTKTKGGGADGKVVASAIQQYLAATKATDQSAQRMAPGKSKAGGFVGENPARKAAQITDMRTPYHNLNAEDMAYLYMVRMGGRNPRHMPVEYQREMAHKAMKTYSAGALDLDTDTYRKVAMKVEFNNTAVAADGADWVPDLWSSQLWMRVRIDNMVAKNLEVFQMPSPTFEYPIESTDPGVYAVGQADQDAEMTLATNVFTRSKLAVTKLQFSAKKLGLQVGFSTEINEDSIIPFIPQLRGQSVRAFANAIDNVILNSDSTTGTGNINYKGANTSAAPTAKFLFGGGNGMRYNALISNPTNVAKSFAGGVPTLAQIRALRFKMISAANAYGVDPNQIVIITDPYTYGSFLNIDEINVFMNNGQNATVNTGMVPNIDGSPVYPSAELQLGDTTGYYPSAGAGTAGYTLGNFVMFAKQGWKVGYVRQVMTDVSYVPYNDVYILTMTARLAIGQKDTYAAAYGYNILVNA